MYMEKTIFFLTRITDLPFCPPSLPPFLSAFPSAFISCFCHRLTHSGDQ